MHVFSTVSNIFNLQTNFVVFNVLNKFDRKKNQMTNDSL